MTNTTTNTATNTAALVLTERIHAPIEAVFDFLVDAEKLSRWMGDVAHDPTPGGDFVLTMGDHVARGTYTVVDPPNSVAYTWGWDHSDTVPPRSTTVTFTLTADGDDTVVELRHDGLPMGPEDEHKVGWSRCLERLPYAAARERLRLAEIELMLQRERVAEQRRALPIGPPVEDYVFGSGDGELSLSSLFSDPSRPLVLYHFMFGKKQEHACPMCSMWVDGWNGVADHLAESVDFAVITSGSVDATAALVEEHGWTNLQVLSAADNTFKLDIGGEDADGNQLPFVSVYEKTADGIRLTYSGSALQGDDHYRGVDLLSPVWHILDLTKPGRRDWMPGGM